MCVCKTDMPSGRVRILRSDSLIILSELLPFVFRNLTQRQVFFTKTSGRKILTRVGSPTRHFFGSVTRIFFFIPHLLPYSLQKLLAVDSVMNCTVFLIKKIKLLLFFLSLIQVGLDDFRKWLMHVGICVNKITI